MKAKNTFPRTATYKLNFFLWALKSEKMDIVTNGWSGLWVKLNRAIAYTDLGPDLKLDPQILHFKISLKCIYNAHNEWYHQPHNSAVVKYNCNKQWMHYREWIGTGKKCYKWVHVRNDIKVQNIFMIVDLKFRPFTVKLYREAFLFFLSFTLIHFKALHKCLI